MSIIYEPKGRAREYAALACNLYTGCNHGCTYCFAPTIRRMTMKQYLVPEVRKNILELFENDCKKIEGSKKAVLFCFMTDPYNSLEQIEMITRKALIIALKYHIPIKILTKSILVASDIDILKQFGKSIHVGLTLTFDNDSDSNKYEPGANIPISRLAAIKMLHDCGIPTWVSMEPVIIQQQSLNMIIKSMPYVDYFKIGKLNHSKIKTGIDWNDFLQNCVDILRGKKAFYVKKDLREAAGKVLLNANEIDMDAFEPEAFV